MNLSPSNDEDEEGRSRAKKSAPTISIISDGSLVTPPPPIQTSCVETKEDERLTAAGTTSEQGVSPIAVSLPLLRVPLLKSLSTTWTRRGEEQTVSFINALSPQSQNDGPGPGEEQQTPLAVVPHNSWERILQCFQVFKPKKVSASDDEDVLSKKKLGSGDNQTGGLKKTMTEGDLFLYELAEKSEILRVEEAVQIGKILPPRAIGYPWDLRFSTSVDGYSLHSLYRKMEGVESPVLLIVEATDQLGVVGAILSTAPKLAEAFYGCGDTSLLKLRPRPFTHYPWSGANSFFIQGRDAFLSVGSEGSCYGLWLDDNLHLGSTDPCCTFGSPSLLPKRDFKVKKVEAFTLASLV